MQSRTTQRGWRRPTQSPQESAEIHLAPRCLAQCDGPLRPGEYARPLQPPVKSTAFQFNAFNPEASCRASCFLAGLRRLRKLGVCCLSVSVISVASVCGAVGFRRVWRIERCASSSLPASVRMPSSLQTQPFSPTEALN